MTRSSVLPPRTGRCRLVLMRVEICHAVGRFARACEVSGGHCYSLQTLPANLLDIVHLSMERVGLPPRWLEICGRGVPGYEGDGLW